MVLQGSCCTVNLFSTQRSADPSAGSRYRAARDIDRGSQIHPPRHRTNSPGSMYCFVSALLRSSAGQLLDLGCVQSRLPAPAHSQHHRHCDCCSNFRMVSARNRNLRREQLTHYREAAQPADPPQASPAIVTQYAGGQVVDIGTLERRTEERLTTSSFQFPSRIEGAHPWQLLPGAPHPAPQSLVLIPYGLPLRPVHQHTASTAGKTKQSISLQRARELTRTVADGRLLFEEMALRSSKQATNYGCPVGWALL